MGVALHQATDAAEADGDGLPDGEVAVGGEALHEGEEVGGGEAAGHYLVPRVVHQVVAVEDGQLRQLLLDAGAQRGVVRHAHEAVATGVDDHGSVGAGHGHAQLVTLE